MDFRPISKPRSIGRGWQAGGEAVELLSEKRTRSLGSGATGGSTDTGAPYKFGNGYHVTVRPKRPKRGTCAPVVSAPEKRGKEPQRPWAWADCHPPQRSRPVPGQHTPHPTTGQPHLQSQLLRTRERFGPIIRGKPFLPEFPASPALAL